MCLYSKTWIPKIAIKDIKVYKAVLPKSDELITLYLKYKVSKIMQTSFIDYIKGILNIKFIHNVGYEINGGFIHSYKTYLNAKFICSRSRHINSGSKYRILEGIIPKGSIYYEDETTYCSNKLILDL